MNKSTPISELPNLKRGDNSNAYEEKENQIVSEILSEIDNSNRENVNMTVDSPQENASGHNEEVNEEIMEQQRMLEQQQRLIQEQNDALSQESNNRRMEDTLNSSVNDNMISNIVNILKQPLIVAIVIGLISIPRIGEMFGSFLSGREKLAPYSTLITLVAKSMIGASMFYGINMNV
jgi:hypothetical protein